jgi:hypothetical protein
MHWWQADPDRLVEEWNELRIAHPSAEVRPETRGIAFRVHIDASPRPLAKATLTTDLYCQRAHPAVLPLAIAVDPPIPTGRWGSHHWHVNTDGSICYADPDWWSPQYLVVEVAAKVGDWWHNTLLLEAGLIEEMPTSGRAEVAA